MQPTRNIILRDDHEVRENLLPLTYTRPVSRLRVGILTIIEKWQRHLPGNYGYATAGYLSAKYPGPASQAPVTLVIASNLLPSTALAAAIEALTPGQSLMSGDTLLAECFGADTPADCAADTLEFSGEVMSVNHLYDIFVMNARALDDDFELITAGRHSAPLSPSCRVVGAPDRIFLEEEARAECAIFNTTAGPIYLGRHAEVMEGAMIRGGLAMLEHSVVNMGAKVYGATTLGPYCKVGGELNNVVMTGYSNKAHDGFLGNAVIGEWCNIGGGSTASNLKNDYTEIKLWNYAARRFLRTGLQFCGLIMGDHSKAGINTMFNTATVFGVGVNFHGSGYPRNFTASFQEGSTAGMTELPLSRFFATAERVMARRGIELTDTDRLIFEEVRNIASQFKG